MSTGYATLYGDMAGGFAVIKDVPKVMVYKLARYRNSLGAVIPERVLTKEPTAELKPGQLDRDTLPAYEELDPILKAYVEEDKDPQEIISSGFDSKTVLKVINMVDKSEYKRRQSPPGIKITPKAFGRDRRMPITNKYRGQNGI
jgi:NAD+ synthase (glutamine-hydrolysing)